MFVCFLLLFINIKKEKRLQFLKKKWKYVVFRAGVTLVRKIVSYYFQFEKAGSGAETSGWNYCAGRPAMGLAARGRVQQGINLLVDFLQIEATQKATGSLDEKNRKSLCIISNSAVNDHWVLTDVWNYFMFVTYCMNESIESIESNLFSRAETKRVGMAFRAAQ